MKIGAVIVTFNRLDKLKNTLACFNKLITKPEYLIVVNNASTDGTEEYLDEWVREDAEYVKKVVTNVENLGGSGGFYVGLEKAMHEDADWIWVSDDDAYPDSDAFNKAEKFLSHVKEGRVSAICGSVVTNDKIDISHRRRVHKRGLKILHKAVDLEEYKKTYFEINEFSYVGAVISKAAMEKVGLTNKDYFLHYDDTEHSLRLNKVGRILCVPAIKITHDTKMNIDADQNMYNSSWQKYYDYRNMLDMIRELYPPVFYKYQYFVYKIKSKVPSLFGLSKSQNAILLAAMDDFKKHKLGKHGLYKPGYKA